MRETIPKLRAASWPRLTAVFWPYEGRAFQLMEKLFNEYPHNRQQLEAVAPPDPADPGPRQVHLHCLISDKSVPPAV